MAEADSGKSRDDSAAGSVGEIPKHYQPSQVESHWNDFWEQQGFFNSEPDNREPFTVLIPPPNVTGVLHMGHMLNNTIQDVLVRRARMLGKNACWVPGTDHASIATEAKVVQKLRAKGIRKRDLTREQFLEHAWEWTHEHGGIILEQLKKLGASCDWNRTRFTLEPDLYEAVIDCFIELHKRGHIYRGKRMIHWDPAALTALSDEEVIYKEVQSNLYHVRYRFAEKGDTGIGSASGASKGGGSEGGADGITIATTRPETILADTAVAVNPKDPRYAHLIGRNVIVPIAGRSIPIIGDDYVEMDFGTGCLKVTPAHDTNDYDLGLKHGLDVIEMLNADGTVSINMDGYTGLDRFDARKKIAGELEALGHLVKIEPITNKVGYSERTDAVIEPRLSLQWFCRMEELARPALENVVNGTIRFHPEKMVNSYQNWMENIRDWCISRQLWWGHRIPAWYFGEGDEDYVIARTEQEAMDAASKKTGRSFSQGDLRQDEDVLDTWFSSWLWPISVFDGFKDPKNKEITYYYPTQDLVTAPEIMFFWVARMIIAGYAFKGEKPFSNVYYHGIVRDKQRRKMSKSLGNSPDPLNLIAEFGADGTRVGMLFSSPAGNDLLFDEALCEQGRNFANKIWNAFRFLMMNRVEGETYTPIEFCTGESAASHAQSLNLADAWIHSRINATISQMNQQLEQYRLNEALHSIYSLIWDDFCDWYIEMIKSPVSGQPIPKESLERALGYFEVLMRLLHPFMPFLTEEIWHRIQPRTPAQALTISPWPTSDGASLSQMDADLLRWMQEIVTVVRNARAELNLPPRKELRVLVATAKAEQTTRLEAESWILNRLQPSVEWTFGTDLVIPEGSRNALVGPLEVFIPLEGLIDKAAERDRLEKEIQRLGGFLKGIDAKLGNAKFVDNAPADVVDKERRKQSDAREALEKLQAMLVQLSD